jgi:hypothetical protein
MSAEQRANIKRLADELVSSGVLLAKVLDDDFDFRVANQQDRHNKLRARLHAAIDAALPGVQELTILRELVELDRLCSELAERKGNLGITAETRYNDPRLVQYRADYEAFDARKQAAWTAAKETVIRGRVAAGELGVGALLTLAHTAEPPINAAAQEPRPGESGDARHQVANQALPPVAAAPNEPVAPLPSAFQQRMREWAVACFGEAIADDKIERNHRFLEEALELVQALGCSRQHAHELVDYVYGRPAGDPVQEVGGAITTLSALCSAQGFDMMDAAERELARIWTKVEVIRAKQAAKPKGSPLAERASPQAVPAGWRWKHGGVQFRTEPPPEFTAWQWEPLYTAPQAVDAPVALRGLPLDLNHEPADLDEAKEMLRRARAALSQEPRGLHEIVEHARAIGRLEGYQERPNEGGTDV